jgi:very-short-patch-repair endonuclease
VRVGGRLTGLSAIAALGGWVLSSAVLHVAIAPNGARLRSQYDRRIHRPAQRIRGVRLHWEEAAGTEHSIVGLRETMRRVVLDESRETAIAALDWGLHTGGLDVFDLAGIMRVVPISRRIAESALDASCESLPESLARTRLRDAGYVVQSQVQLNNGQRIDLVVDGIVGLEVDGEQFHRDRFEQDRAKDARIIQAGLVAYRPSARSVFADWASVQATIDSAIHARRFGNSGNCARFRAGGGVMRL